MEALPPIFTVRLISGAGVIEAPSGDALRRELDWWWLLSVVPGGFCEVWGLAPAGDRHV
jgi:hypothetical protein